MRKTFNGAPVRLSHMEQKIGDAVLDAEARIGATRFPAGTPVLELIRHAQQHFKVRQLPGDDVSLKAPSGGDPWIAEMYRITTDYHIQTGKRVPIMDLYDTFFATSIKGVDTDDRAAFEARLRERLSEDSGYIAR